MSLASADFGMRFVTVVIPLPRRATFMIWVGMYRRKFNGRQG